MKNENITLSLTLVERALLHVMCENEFKHCYKVLNDDNYDDETQGYHRSRMFILGSIIKKFDSTYSN